MKSLLPLKIFSVIVHHRRTLSRSSRFGHGPESLEVPEVRTESLFSSAAVHALAVFKYRRSSAFPWLDGQSDLVLSLCVFLYDGTTSSTNSPCQNRKASRSLSVQPSESPSSSTVQHRFFLTSNITRYSPHLRACRTELFFLRRRSRFLSLPFLFFPPAGRKQALLSKFLGSLSAFSLQQRAHRPSVATFSSRFLFPSTSLCSPLCCCVLTVSYAPPLAFLESLVDVCSHTPPSLRETTADIS